ncbi:MAG: signal peptidase II [Bacilli bacterium]|nr:signal peptidase II [Bacilli bacterium]
MRKKSLTFASFFIVFDQIIKMFINNVFSYGDVATIIPHFLNITKIYNPGAAWSLLAGGRYLLIVIAVCAFGMLLAYQKCFAYKERTIFGFALIYGGLIGNLIDRCFLGYVIDYIEVFLGNYHFPIFNLADICLVTGFMLVIIALLKGEDKYEFKKLYKRHKSR